MVPDSPPRRHAYVAGVISIQEQQQRREQSKKSFVAPISPFRESIGIGTYFCAQNLNLRIFFLTHLLLH